MAASRPCSCMRHILSAKSAWGSTSVFSSLHLSTSIGTVPRATTSNVTGCDTSMHSADRHLHAWARTCSSSSTMRFWRTGTVAPWCMRSRPCLSCAMSTMMWDVSVRTVGSLSVAPSLRAGTRPTSRNFAISMGALQSLSIMARAFWRCTSSSAVMSLVSLGCVARSNASVTESAGSSSGLGMHANLTRCLAFTSKPSCVLRS
mmetsp:Transcript_21039/g.56628  ORF Transcript_21039/g.56628 Transcript_21039/m.56628 type:complete len:203 (+) Transcript_21039:828-1436(+)